MSASPSSWTSTSGDGQAGPASKQAPTDELDTSKFRVYVAAAEGQQDFLRSLCTAMQHQHAGLASHVFWDHPADKSSSADGSGAGSTAASRWFDILHYAFLVVIVISEVFLQSKACLNKLCLLLRRMQSKSAARGLKVVPVFVGDVKLSDMKRALEKLQPGPNLGFLDACANASLGQLVVLEDGSLGLLDQNAQAGSMTVGKRLLQRLVPLHPDEPKCYRIQCTGAKGQVPPAGASDKQLVELVDEAKRHLEALGRLPDAVRLGGFAEELQKQNRTCLDEPCGGQYHVYISHSGAQKAGLVSFLYDEFKNRNSELAKHIFLDFVSLASKKGNKNYPAMLHALEHSFVAIVVISREFLKSPDPMDELHLLLQQQEAHPGKKIVLPVFYDLSWNEVWDEVEKYRTVALQHGQAQPQHSSEEAGLDRCTALQYAANLEEFATITGFTGFYAGGKEWYEKQRYPAPELVAKIVDEVQGMLAGMGQLVTGRKQALVDPKGWLKQHLPASECMQSLLDRIGEARGSKQALLIHGLPGVGKSTQAKAAFNQLHTGAPTVPASFLTLPGCQITDIEVVELQCRLLSDLAHVKKTPADLRFSPSTGQRELRDHLKDRQVLLVVDNVWDGQLDKLLPADIMTVLAADSAVLVISRSPVAPRALGKTVLVHEVSCMSADDSRALLEFYFKQQDGYEDWHKHWHNAAVQVAVGEDRCGGLPAALIALALHITNELGTGGLQSRAHDGPERRLELVRGMLLLAYAQQDSLFSRIKQSWDLLGLLPRSSACELLMEIVWFLKGQQQGWVEAYCRLGALDLLERVGLIRCSRAGGGQVGASRDVGAVMTVHQVVEDFCRTASTTEELRSRMKAWHGDDIGPEVLRIASSEVEDAVGVLLCGLKVRCQVGQKPDGWVPVGSDGTLLPRDDVAGQVALFEGALDISKKLRVIQMERSQVCMERLSLQSPQLGWVRLDEASFLTGTLKHIYLELPDHQSGPLENRAVVVLDGLKHLEELEVRFPKRLRRLRARRCPKLRRIKFSGPLGSELFLDVTGCEELSSIAGLANSKLLTVELAGCNNAELLAETLGGMCSLEELTLETSVDALPDSIFKHGKLVYVDLRRCPNMMRPSTPTNCKLEMFEASSWHKDGNTALPRAAQASHLEELKHFLTEGADAQAKNKEGETPANVVSGPADHGNAYKVAALKALLRHACSQQKEGGQNSRPSAEAALVPDALICCVPTGNTWELAAFLQDHFVSEYPALKVQSSDMSAPSLARLLQDPAQLDAPIVVLIVQEPSRSNMDPVEFSELIAERLLPQLPVLAALTSTKHGKRLVLPVVLSEPQLAETVGLLLWDEGSSELDQWRGEVKEQAALRSKGGVYGPTLVQRVVQLSTAWLAAEQKLPLIKDEALPDITTTGLLKRAADLAEVAHKGAAASAMLMLLHGPAGVGKTTLAKAIFNDLHKHDRTVRCCFLRLPAPDAAGETADAVIVEAQKKLLAALAWPERLHEESVQAGRDMLTAVLGKGLKALVVLDNVWGGQGDQEGQLEKLLPPEFMRLLAPGSVVLVTSRDLEVCSGDKFVFKAQRVLCLADDEAMQLLCQHAYRGKHLCMDDSKQYLQQLLEQCGGLPLALEVVGRHLASGLSAEEFVWDVHGVLSFVFSERRAGRPDLQQTVFGALEVSWRVLTHEEQQGLLDLAWYLKGLPLALLECCIDKQVLRRLEQLALVSFKEKEGQEVVEVHSVVVAFCKMGLKASGKLQRLELAWDEDVDRDEVLEELKELVDESVCGLSLTSSCVLQPSLDQLVKPGPSLQLLQLREPASLMDSSLKIQLAGLRCLHLWSDTGCSEFDCQQQSDPGDNGRLALLDMPRLSLVVLERVRGQKCLELYDSCDNSCGSLRGLHLAACGSLQSLNMELPAVGEGLQYLHISGCPNLRPNLGGLAFCFMPSLQHLHISGCQRLECVVFGSKAMLRHLHISGCPNLHPLELGSMPLLQHLHISELSVTASNGIINIARTPALQHLCIRSCRTAGELMLRDMTALRHMHISNCQHLEVQLVGSFSSLQHLHFASCSDFRAVDVDMPTLQYVHLSGCWLASLGLVHEPVSQYLQRVPASAPTPSSGMHANLCGLASLQHVNIANCACLHTLHLDNTTTLRELSISYCYSLTTIRGLEGVWGQLTRLKVSGNKHLEDACLAVDPGAGVAAATRPSFHDWCRSRRGWDKLLQEPQNASGSTELE